MSCQKRAQGKFSKEGASAPKRGAPSTRMVVVKEEPVDSEHVTSSANLQRLRTIIMNKREAKGLGHIPVQFLDPVKYEMTPEEIERRERRKEQNRRAARKCRLKKRQQQNSVADNHAKLEATIREQENEINRLRQQNALLNKSLQDRAQIAPCPSLVVTTAAGSDGVQSSHVPVTSPPTSHVASDNSPLDLDALMSSAPSAETAVDLDTYLEGLWPLLPDVTFQEIDDMNGLTQVTNLKGNIPLSSPSPPLTCASVPCSQQSLPPLPSFSPPDPMESLKTLMPSSPRVSCLNQSLLCPVSPTTNHDRQSVSSMASDSSPAPELSQGFSVPSASVGSPGSRGMEGGSSDFLYLEGSSGDSDATDSLSSPAGFNGTQPRLVPEITVEDVDDEEEDDDVFSRGDVSTTITDENLFQQYFKNS